MAQHVLDTLYLYKLSERILLAKYRLNPGQGPEGAIRGVGCDLHDAAQKRWCDCDPDERWEEGFDEDSDEGDGWFCSYRSIEGEYRMHAVLEQARLDIEADPGEFPKAIYEEIVERCNLEHTKVLEAQAQKHASSDEQIQVSPSPSPPYACAFPPFSFQQLPPEILIEIALLAQADDPHAHINLSHVDASLRAFVNSAPLLWSRVDILYPLHVVDRYLERSADVLLKVTPLLPLHTTSSFHRVLQDVGEDENNKLKNFMRALPPHRHRIHSLRLRCDHLLFDLSGVAEGLTAADGFMWDGSMVELEMLDLELGLWTWHGLKAVPSSYAIKELHLHASWTRDYLPLFSSSLESLVITDERAPFAMIFDALQAAPRLISLTLCDMPFVGIGEKKGATLNLDQLESLSLLRIVGSAAEALFNCIVAPNLTSIALQLVERLHLTTDPTDINQLQLFTAPRPSVRHLDLTACDGDTSFFASAFRAFPYLTHLRIASSNLSEDHLLPLAGCPKLKHLTIDNEFNDITHVIVQIAGLRQIWGFPLESVTLRGVPADHGLFDGFLRLEDIVDRVEIAEFDQELDVYEDSDGGSVSETSSEGDWASGDEEIIIAYWKLGGVV